MDTYGRLDTLWPNYEFAAIRHCVALILLLSWFTAPSWLANLITYFFRAVSSICLWSPRNIALTSDICSPILNKFWLIFSAQNAYLFTPQTSVLNPKHFIVLYYWCNCGRICVCLRVPSLPCIIRWYCYYMINIWIFYPVSVIFIICVYMCRRKCADRVCTFVYHFHMFTEYQWCFIYIYTS